MNRIFLLSYNIPGKSLDICCNQVMTNIMSNNLSLMMSPNLLCGLASITEQGTLGLLQCSNEKMCPVSIIYLYVLIQISILGIDINKITASMSKSEVTFTNPSALAIKNYYVQQLKKTKFKLVPNISIGLFNNYFYK